jgi:hypothetical protein
VPVSPFIIVVFCTYLLVIVNLFLSAAGPVFLQPVQGTGGEAEARQGGTQAGDGGREEEEEGDQAGPKEVVHKKKPYECILYKNCLAFSQI